ncbi:uncharacterized protein LOC124672498 [Lolium rigidum]|uniref:uncharacterized protein LOC124672498 n=1 Tax=Lolium rigidum TaxID=89674 RepID=UPI001F5DA05B|nr:uncharacterized protein LOC124672498 [Lolium rigidum]
MAGKSKRTTAPVPPESPWPTAQPVRPPAAQPVPPAMAQSIPLPAIPSMFASGSWLPPRPPQSMAASSPPCWLAGVAQPSDFLAQGSWWTPPAGTGGSAQPTPPAGNLEAYNLQAWGFDSHSPGDFPSFFANTSSHTQAVENGTSSQPINVGDNANGDDCTRTEKRLLWTKEEDLRLVGAWLNNSNDPIQSNYRKNEQYWKEVAAVYNSTTPKNRARLVKHVKDRFAKIKKKVAWFCASWKEANALYASGESDVDLKKRAMQTYEEDHKEDGPFMFHHCWEVLKKEPKWDAYLERLEDPEPERRKFSVDDEVGSISL